LSWFSHYNFFAIYSFSTFLNFILTDHEFSRLKPALLGAATDQNKPSPAGGKKYLDQSLDVQRHLLLHEQSKSKNLRRNPLNQLVFIGNNSRVILASKPKTYTLES